MKERIQSALSAIAEWNDPKLLAACRESLVWSEIEQYPTHGRSSNERFVQQLEQWFGKHKVRETATDSSSPANLFQQGHCPSNQKARLLGLYCRAVGLETRLVVGESNEWLEVWLDQSVWRPIGAPSIAGLAVAVAVDHVVDVTPRYHASATSTAELESLIADLHGQQQASMPDRAREELQQRLTKEQSRFQAIDLGDPLPFGPPNAGVVSIVVQPPLATCTGEAIQVSGTGCAMGTPDTLSVVIVDDDYLGCILQSMQVSSLRELYDFVRRVPTQRIVAVAGRLSLVDTTPSAMDTELPGFQSKHVTDGILYVGQVRCSPDWIQCATYNDGPVRVQAWTGQSNLQLAIQQGIRPFSVSGRLPEHIMPLGTQVLATEDQKKTAFARYAEQATDCAGFTTQPGLPVYLLDRYAFPVEHVPASDAESTWTTGLMLPQPLVPPPPKSSSNLVDVPLAEDFFVQSLGSQLLVKSNGSATRTGTVEALRNTRLVALYFSAHWCGPCRSFTPMLAEMYQYLKDEHPSHGLEIVFVSSDRDAASFNSYYNSMPWMALPMDGNYAHYKQLLSTTYGVRGIPSLVVLDAMSGQIVVGADSSRREVMQACNMGDEGIERLLQSWLDRIPTESKEILTVLEMSCVDDQAESNGRVETYLVQEPPKAAPTKEETQARIKTIFNQLVEKGMEANSAAAKAIQLVSSGLEPSRLDGVFQRAETVELRSEGCKNVATVISTALKYVENAAKDPSKPQFRYFKLSNKVADRITREPGGLNLLRELGIDVVRGESDYYGSLPLAADLNALRERIEKRMKESAE